MRFFMYNDIIKPTVVSLGGHAWGLNKTWVFMYTTQKERL